MGSPTTTLFISYSHENERWLERLLVHLKPLHLDIVWSDKRIKPGDDWIREIKAALARAEVAVLLVSADFVASDFINSVELPSLLQSVERQSCKVFPIIVGSCLFSSIKDLQRFQAINSPGEPLERMKKAQAEEVLTQAASAIEGYLSDRGEHSPDNEARGRRDITKASKEFVSDPYVDRLLQGVRLADWSAAEEAALQIIAKTDSSGQNGTFNALLSYQGCSSEDERLWGALQTIECCVHLAPWIITHSQLSRMTAHGNFSVRSAAASICMDLAHSAPGRMPLDLAMKLSVYDEDWYVQAPANAALKAMVRTTPEVLRIFRVRLRSRDCEEAIHAAKAIRDIAEKEPGLLDPNLLRRDFVGLKKSGNKEAANQIRAAISKARKAKRTDHYRYGL
jgi:TIR domain